MTVIPARNTIYDHRVRQAIAYSGDINLFPNMKIPISTTKDWVKKGIPKVEEELPFHYKSAVKEMALKNKIRRLEAKLKSLEELVKIKNKVYNILDFDIAKHKKVKVEQKKEVVELLEAHKNIFSQKEICQFTGISKSRHYRWKKEIQQEDTEKIDSYVQKHSCSLTINEFYTMKNLYEDKSFSHYSIKSLFFHAKRKNALHCSLGTWYKYAKIYQFKRPVNKLQIPEQRLLGIQSNCPSELLHIDITELKILNGTKYFLQAIIDNFSRYIVGWSLNSNKKALHSTNLIKKSLNENSILKPKIMMDKGTENINTKVDQLIKNQQFTRIIARKDTHFSNSKIESFFRSLKSNHLKNQYMWSQSDLLENVTFYIEEYNEFIPHSSLNGLTPKEAFQEKPIEDVIQSWPLMKKEALNKRKIEYWKY